ncbi:low-density lipoprotein receptor-related protein 2-like [Arapaima gigas]
MLKEVLDLNCWVRQLLGICKINSVFHKKKLNKATTTRVLNFTSVENMPPMPGNITQGLSLLPCDAELCHGHGRCFVLHEKMNCECHLGYKGEFCQNRVSNSISAPLTLGVLGCIVGFVVLAFLLAFLKKRTKAYKRKVAAAIKINPNKGPL